MFASGRKGPLSSGPYNGFWLYGPGAPGGEEPQIPGKEPIILNFNWRAQGGPGRS